MRVFRPRHHPSSGATQGHGLPRRHPLRWRAVAPGALLTGFFLALCATAASAQITEYEDYPKTRGQIERFQTPAMPAWLRLDGELRGRPEGQTALGTGFQDGAGYLLSRVRGGARITPLRPLQFYIQFQDTHALGLSSKLTSSNMHDNFDLYQGYMQLRGGPATLIAGRQELRFGSERVIGVSDFTNNARSFDGFDLRLGQHRRVDIFTASVVVVHPTSLDTHGAGLTFHGIYGQFDTLVPGANIQPFLLFSEKPGIVDGRGSRGAESQATVGAEVSGSAWSKRINYDGLLDFQRGSYASQSIHAGAGYAKVSYALPNWTWAPRFGAEFDYASGSSASDRSRRGTYDQLYPSNHDAFGLVDLFGFQNIRQERLNIDLSPKRYLTVLLQAGHLDLASREDAVYASSGAALIPAPAGGFATNTLGNELDASAKYLLGESLVLNIGAGHLFADQNIANREALGSKTFGYASLTYRFSFSHDHDSKKARRR